MNFLKGKGPPGQGIGGVVPHSKRRQGARAQAEQVLGANPSGTGLPFQLWKRGSGQRGEHRRGCDLVEGAWFSAVIVFFYIYISWSKHFK